MSAPGGAEPAPATAASTGPSPGPHPPVAPTPPAHHAIWMRLLAGVVVAVVGTVVLVKVVGGAGSDRVTTSLSPTSATVLHEVSTVPASVFNAVGVRSGVVPVQAPVLLHDAAPLTAPVAGGGRVPVVVFVGTGYCSFCAAERWPLVVALSRFGTFRSLYDDESSPTDFAPNTPTFSFYGARYASRYLRFDGYETRGDVLEATGYQRLMLVSKQVATLRERLDPSGDLPFVDVANVALAREVAMSPVTYDGVSRDQVAAALVDATDPVARSIVASANYLTAAICDADGERPGSVCASSGVRAADAALGLAAAR